jgi:cell division protein FtsI (penicillin-binding protein 3)
MAKHAQYKRLLMLALALVAAFACVGYRLFDLQVLRHDDLKKEAQDQTKYVYRLQPRRGDILDIRGSQLATSEFVKTVCADPTLVSNRYVEVARAIAPLLQMKEADLIPRLTPRLRQTDKGEQVPVQYVVLKGQVSADTWAKIHDTMGKLVLVANEKNLPKKEQAFYDALRRKAIFTDPMDDQRRTYPNGALAAHVLGFAQTVVRTNDDIRTRECVGVDGIERALNERLTGVSGWRVSERDGRRHEVVALREQEVEPHDGLNVVLTIDSVIQHIVESALAEGMEKFSPVSISGIVIRPRTGEVLAMAVLPNFDPNDPGAKPDDARRNRLISDNADPGSTFKIVVVSGALNDHVVNLTDEVFCEDGTFHYAGVALHDHEHYGTLAVKGVITKSSNIGAAKIGIQMGAERLYGYMRDFGFGSKTGICLPGEVWGDVRPLKSWYKVSVAQIPMGQGVTVTSLQMAMAMCAVANKGVLMRPMLVDRLMDDEGRVALKYQPQPVRRVISEEADAKMIEALKTVVTADGTAPKAALEHYTVAGKTGTAQKVPYSSGKFYSSFVGFFPADNPEICIYISLDDPKGTHYGGQVAAPIFKQIAEKAANYLNIRPDKISDQPVLGAVAPGQNLIKTGLAGSANNPKNP